MHVDCALCGLQGKNSQTEFESSELDTVECEIDVLFDLHR
jgi:hypothetical protein